MQVQFFNFSCVVFVLVLDAGTSLSGILECNVIASLSRISRRCRDPKKIFELQFVGRECIGCSHCAVVE